MLYLEINYLNQRKILKKKKYVHFKFISRGQILDDFQNFDNFGNSLHILFRCSTGEDWYSIMFDCNKFMNTGTNMFIN